jgi:hypothetical protein
MTCPNCKCQTCREASKAAMQAILRSHVVPRETDSELRKAFALQPRYTLRDPHAEQLALDVVREQERVGT